MPIQNLENWYLRKHGDSQVFGPVRFAKIQQWAKSAQIAPQDEVSENGTTWTKAPMVPELGMDWLVHLREDSYYGPTTSEALLEFFQLGEISEKTQIINCCTGTEIEFGQADFFPAPAEEEIVIAPAKRSIRHSLQQRIRELELALVEKNRQLQLAEDRIRRLETRVQDLESVK